MVQFGLISLVSALLFLGPAAAVDFHFYQYAKDCSGIALWSIYGAVNSKCYIRSNATSVGVHFVPSGAKPQSYSGNATNGCSNFVGEGAAGYSCLKGVINSANWFNQTPKLARKTPEPEERFSVTYEQPGGASREVEVPEGHVARALKLVEAKNYDALAEFPSFVKKPDEHIGH